MAEDATPVYDITNGEQLRILNERLDDMATLTLANDHKIDERAEAVSVRLEEMAIYRDRADRDTKLRADAVAHAQVMASERLDQLVADGAKITTEWALWRKNVMERLADHTALIAERLSHPLMDPKTVEGIQAMQVTIIGKMDALEQRPIVDPADVAEIKEAVAWQLGWHRWLGAHKKRIRVGVLGLVMTPVVFDTFLRALLHHFGWI